MPGSLLAASLGLSPSTRRALPPHARRVLFAGGLFFLAILAAGGAENTPANPASPATPVASPFELPGVEHLFRLSPRLYSGGTPEGERGFRTLEQLGIKTIISVDGARPDVETARRYGLRYVHLPIGYDEVDPRQALRLLKAAGELPGPLFVHCHHGKHRGPAAAAIIARSTEGWDSDRACAWLRQAGTSPAYSGLYTSVDRFEKPPPEALASLPADFPERTEVAPLTEAMVVIDGCWERLQQGLSGELRSAELSAGDEARLLFEHFRELARTEEARDKGQAFLDLLAEAESTASALDAALRKTSVERGTERHLAREALLQRLDSTCTACHARFRDQ